MSGSTQQQPAAGTNGRTVGRPRKASGAARKRTQRTAAQIAAAGLAPGKPAVEAIAMPAVKQSTLRLATMLQWFSEATPADQKLIRAGIDAVALPKAA